MNKKKKNAVVKEKVSKPSLKDKIIVLLTEHKSGLTRTALAEKLGKTEFEISVAFVSLRKEGFKIWPSKGPGTPFKIARSAGDAIKYVAWRRSRFLDVSRRMIMTEQELGEQYEELAKSYEEALKLLSQNNYELPESIDKEAKARQKSA
jgi:biotin operon repressor